MVIGKKIISLLIVVAIFIGSCQTSFSLEQDIYTSVHETEAEAVNLLCDDIVFMTNCDQYFVDGKKLSYSDSEAYIDENGFFIATAALLSETLDVEIKVEGNNITANGKTAQIGSIAEGQEEFEVAPMVRDGVLYLPVVSFAHIMLSRYVYEDERGFILISLTDRQYSNSSFARENFETIDVIYRYMQYERPNGDELYEAMQACSKGEYPRTLVKKSDLPELRQRIAEDSELSEALRILRIKCDGYINAQVVPYSLPDDLRLFEAANEVSVRLRNLGVAYLVTEEKKYAERMWLELQNAVLDWPDWNVNKHFLDSGRLAPGVAFAYDVLHDYLTEEQRRTIRTKIDILYLDAAVNCFDGSGLYLDAMNFRLTQHNWGAVCASGMLLLSLVLMDEEAEGSEFNEKCKFIAENAMQSLEYPLGMFFPDGPTGEGVQYWDFYVEHIAFSIETLMNMCGDDYGFLDTPGYKTAPEFLMYIQTKEGWYNHSSTMGFGPFWSGAVYHIAARFNDTEAMSVYEERRKILGQPMDANCLLWYKPQKDGNVNGVPLDKHFGGEDIVTMHGSWTDTEASFLALRAGLMHEHGHYDKGSFIYDNGGVRWFEDLGPEQYNIEGGYDAVGGSTLYRVRTEAHNGMVINPSASDSGQQLGGIATVERFESKKRGAFAVVNLTSLYSSTVKEYRRGFYMGDDRETLIVQDELELLEEDNSFYYFLHTKGDITIAPDSKSATITRDYKTLKIEFICNASNWKLSERNEENLFPENDRNGETDRTAYKKIVLEGNAKGKLIISARFSLVDENEYPPHTLSYIDLWNIPDGEILESPKIRGVDKAYLLKETVDFDVLLPEKYQTAYVLCNGKMVAELIESNDGYSYNVKLACNTLHYGKNILAVKMETADSIKIVNQSFEILPGAGGFSWKQDMSAWKEDMSVDEYTAALELDSVTDTTDVNGQKAHHERIEGLSGIADDVALAFVADRDNTDWSSGYPLFSKNIDAKQGIARINFDVYVEDLANPGYLYLKGLDASGQIAYNHFFFKDGGCGDAGKYEIEVTYNLDRGEYQVLCNDKKILVPSAEDNTVFTPLKSISRVSFVGPVYRPGKYVAFDNVEIINYNPTTLTVTKEGINVKNIDEPCVLVAASYKNHQMIDSKMFNITVATDIIFAEQEEFNIKDADMVVGFLWKNITDLRPICNFDQAYIK